MVWPSDNVGASFDKEIFCDSVRILDIVGWMDPGVLCSRRRGVIHCISDNIIDVFIK
jgi:hypothetical protein